MPPRSGADSFTTFVLDQLRGLGAVEARSMFGGKGLYWREQIFGLIDEGRLYFRVSPATVAAYREKGSQPFEPWPGHVMKGYHEVPASVLEDTDEAVAWAREAWSLPRAQPRKKSGGRTHRQRSGKRPLRRAPSR
jgi:DNA transformation protein